MATNEKKKKTAEPETVQDAAQVNPETVEQQDTDATADASKEAAQEEPAQEAAQADTEAAEQESKDAAPDAETTAETAPEEAPEVLQEVARSLMREHGVSVVYRCPKNGYWFINEQYVNEYQLESGNVVDVYRDEVKAPDHDA